MVWDIPPGQGALLLILLGSGIPWSCPKGCHQQGWLPQQWLSRSPVLAIPPLGCSHPAAAEMGREHLPGATASPLLFTCCQQACEICIRHWVRCYLEYRMYLWQWSVWKKISPKHSMNSKLCNCQCSFPEEPLAPDAKDLAVGQYPPTAYLQSRVYSAKAALLPQLAACKVEGLSAADTVHWIYGEWHVLHPVEFSFITQADDQLNPFLSIGCLCNSWSLHCFLPWVPTK